MEAWAWLAAFLGGFVLLQLVLYRYVQGGESASDRPPGGPGDATGARSDPGRDVGGEPAPESRTEGKSPRRSTESANGDGVRCTHCGASNENEATFKYCRRCANPLR